MSIRYMHTLDGRPAMYWPGEQIAFMGFYGRPLRLEKDLKAIKRNIAATKVWRKKRGFNPDRSTYGWLRVTV